MWNWKTSQNTMAPLPAVPLEDIPSAQSPFALNYMRPNQNQLINSQAGYEGNMRAAEMARSPYEAQRFINQALQARAHNADYLQQARSNAAGINQADLGEWWQQQLSPLHQAMAPQQQTQQQPVAQQQASVQQPFYGVSEDGSTYPTQGNYGKWNSVTAGLDLSPLEQSQGVGVNGDGLTQAFALANYDITSPAARQKRATDQATAQAAHELGMTQATQPTKTAETTGQFNVKAETTKGQAARDVQALKTRAAIAKAMTMIPAYDQQKYRMAQAALTAAIKARDEFRSQISPEMLTQANPILPQGTKEFQINERMRTFQNQIATAQATIDNLHRMYPVLAGIAPVAAQVEQTQPAVPAAKPTPSPTPSPVKKTNKPSARNSMQTASTQKIYTVEDLLKEGGRNGK